jgi:hypothetical protein
VQLTEPRDYRVRLPYPAAVACSTPVGLRPYSGLMPFSSLLTISFASLAFDLPCRMSLRMGAHRVARRIAVAPWQGVRGSLVCSSSPSLHTSMYSAAALREDRFLTLCASLCEMHSGGAAATAYAAPALGG